MIYNVHCRHISSFHLSHVAYTLAQAFTLESRLSQIERVVFLKFICRIRRDVNGQSDSCEFHGHNTMHDHY